MNRRSIYLIEALYTLNSLPVVSFNINQKRLVREEP